MSVRAKFRCLGVDSRWDGSHIAELGPIYAGDGAPDNAKYFEATPQGHAEVKTGPDCMFKPNNAYYIDMVPVDGGLPCKDVELYRLQSVEDRGSSIVVKFASGWVRSDGIQHGHLEMTIDNKEAWPYFKGHVDSQWRVNYTEAFDG